MDVRGAKKKKKKKEKKGVVCFADVDGGGSCFFSGGGICIRCSDRHPRGIIKISEEERYSCDSRATRRNRASTFHCVVGGSPI